MDALGSVTQPRDAGNHGANLPARPGRDGNAHAGAGSGAVGFAAVACGTDRPRDGPARDALACLLPRLPSRPAASYEMYQVLNVQQHDDAAARAAGRLHRQLCLDRAAICEWAGGFVALWRGRGVSGITVPTLQQRPSLTTRTALLMPIYNEAPQRIFAGLQAIYESLDAIGALEHFDFFILSDTTEPRCGWRKRWDFGSCAGVPRVRDVSSIGIVGKNTRRKAGNIADFCQRWGARYEHMVVLDADSLMTGEALVQLAAAMEAHPRGRSHSDLATGGQPQYALCPAQQFAARLYGPSSPPALPTGIVGDSSYWGHNAIIRTRAFIEHAGLPDLPGRRRLADSS